MKIAILCENEEINGLVPRFFKDSPFLMIVDADHNQIIKIYGRRDEENIFFANKVVEHDCEAIICGQIEREPFEIMVARGVTRFNGSGHKAQKAYDYMMQNRLPLIPDYIGGPGLGGHSHSGCNEGTPCGER